MATNVPSREDMRIAAARVPHARLIVLGVAAVACILIFALARSFTFLYDEWIFITTAPTWTARTYLEPHNEHPVMLLRVFYMAMLDTVGLRSYMPYLVALLVAHAVDVTLLFEVVKRRAGEAVGIAAAVVLAVLGAGTEDLFSAFQISWLMSIAFGLAALLALPRRPALAAAFIAISLMWSGIGVSFAAAAGVQLLLTPGGRRGLLWFVPVAVALAAWYVAFGRHGVHPNPRPTLANIYLAIPYTVWGLAQGAAAIVGQGGWSAAYLLAPAAAAVMWRWRSHGLDPLDYGVVAAMAAMYVTTGLTRAQLGFGQASASRYLYVDAVFWMILLAAPAAALPWRGAWRPALAACLALVCFNNLVVLFEHAGTWTVLTDRQVADLQALDSMRHDPCLDPTAFVDPQVMVYGGTPKLYYPAVDRYGDPVSGRPITDTADYEAAVARLRKPGC